MQENELKDLVDSILQKKTETADIEFKSAKEGYPEKLYDSFSSFSNTNGGIILFGIDEKAGYKVCGVKDPDLLEKKIVEQAKEMEPVVRPHITICNYDGKTVVAAEITEMAVVSEHLPKPERSFIHAALGILIVRPPRLL